MVTDEPHGVAAFVWATESAEQEGGRLPLAVRKFCSGEWPLYSA